MALFNRDYDRDYRYRNTGMGYGGGMARNDNRDFGDRMRAGWNNMTGGTRNTTNNYDRDYTANTGTWNRGYETENRGNLAGGNDYDRDYRYRGTPGGRVGGGLTNDYDRDFNRARTVARGYDTEYKTRWQTDQGDPFNDRQRQTPFRVTRGEYEGGYDRDFNRNNTNRNYDRDFNQGNQGYYSTGVGYDPYNNPNEYNNRGSAWNERQNRGYDRGFF